MSERFYPICLHKSEWDRLKRQGGPLIPERATQDTKIEYLDALNEQSRKWIELWPDSAEGAREKIKQLRRKQRKENHLLMDWYKSRTREDPQVAVKRAKQLIFDDSCYGRQLISAVVESNILEEREAQIEFQKKIKQQEAELEKGKKYNDSPLITNVTDEEIKANRKRDALECVKYNAEIERIKKEQAAKLKAEKVICESVDEDMVKLVRDLKTKKKAEKLFQLKKGLEEYEAERKQVAIYRKKVEDRNNALTAAYKKEQDQLKCKIDAVYKKVIEEQRHGGRAQKLYKVIDEIQKAETKRYNDFIEKGIEKQEQGYLKHEAKEAEIDNMKRVERCKIAEDNKIAGKLHKLYIEHTSPGNKCVCDVQTLLFKPDAKKQVLKKNRDEFDRKNDMQTGSPKSVKESSECKINREELYTKSDMQTGSVKTVKESSEGKKYREELDTVNDIQTGSPKTVVTSECKKNREELDTENDLQTRSPKSVKECFECKMNREKLDTENDIQIESPKTDEVSCEGMENRNELDTIIDIQIVSPKTEEKDASEGMKNREELDTKHDIQTGSPKTAMQSPKDKYFLKPRTNLVQALRQREKEPSGYTGGDSKDKYFAEQASEALQRSKHKYFARKVVDDYIKENRIKASDLSVSNY